MLQSVIDGESERESMNFHSSVVRTISYSGGGNAFANFTLAGFFWYGVVLSKFASNDEFSKPIMHLKAMKRNSGKIPFEVGCFLHRLF